MSTHWLGGALNGAVCKFGASTFVAIIATSTALIIFGEATLGYMPTALVVNGVQVFSTLRVLPSEALLRTTYLQRMIYYTRVAARSSAQCARC